jgi:hypothetical protein
LENLLKERYGTEPLVGICTILPSGGRLWYFFGPWGNLMVRQLS